MAIKYDRVATFNEEPPHKVTSPFDRVVLQGHVTN